MRFRDRLFLLFATVLWLLIVCHLQGCSSSDQPANPAAPYVLDEVHSGTWSVDENGGIVYSYGVVILSPWDQPRPNHPTPSRLNVYFRVPERGDWCFWVTRVDTVDSDGSEASSYGGTTVTSPGGAAVGDVLCGISETGVESFFIDTHDWPNGWYRLHVEAGERRDWRDIVIWR